MPRRQGGAHAAVSRRPSPEERSAAVWLQTTAGPEQGEEAGELCPKAPPVPQRRRANGPRPHPSPELAAQHPHAHRPADLAAEGGGGSGTHTEHQLIRPPSYRTGAPARGRAGGKEFGRKRRNAGGNSPKNHPPCTTRRREGEALAVRRLSSPPSHPSSWLLKEGGGGAPRGATRPTLMILPQVHLRKPCYDFYFL